MRELLTLGIFVGGAYVAFIGLFDAKSLSLYLAGFAVMWLSVVSFDPKKNQ